MLNHRVDWKKLYRQIRAPDNQILAARQELVEGYLELLEGDAYVTVGRDLEAVFKKYGEEIALAACVSIILSARANDLPHALRGPWKAAAQTA